MKTCEHCKREFEGKRRDARFCQTSCRVNHHKKLNPPKYSPDMDFNPSEAGLLLDAQQPWRMPAPGKPGLVLKDKYPNEKCEGGKCWNAQNFSMDHLFRITMQGRAVLREAHPTCGACQRNSERDSEVATIYRRFSAARRRLLKLGLLEHLRLGTTIIVRRTKLGDEVVSRRHNQFHAIAEHAGHAWGDKGGEYLAKLEDEEWNWQSDLFVRDDAWSRDRRRWRLLQEREEELRARLKRPRPQT